MKVKILTTGGTFDKIYDPLLGELVFNHSAVPCMLKRGGCLLDIQVENLFLIDSLEMQISHREAILKACKGALESKIVMIHGTDTLTETALFLQKHHLDKTIVITGSMIPYAFKNSDSLFNLGFALGVVQTLPHGVYVAFHGQYFKAQEVYKNKEKGIFEKIEKREKP